MSTRCDDSWTIASIIRRVTRRATCSMRTRRLHTHRGLDERRFLNNLTSPTYLEVVATVLIGPGPG